MNLARSTYYYQPHRRPEDEGALERRIEGICDEFPRYGYRRVTAQLQHEGWRVNHKRVARIMREEGLSVKLRRRTVPTSDGGRGEAVFPNLARGVRPTGPNQLWVGDITYIRTRAAFAYLAVILDAWSRRVVGYAVSQRIDTRLTIAALRAALAYRQPPPGCIHHTDRGSQYGSVPYRAILAEWGLQGSMSRRGNPYDNAQAESFIKDAEKRRGSSQRLRDLRRRGGSLAALPRSGLQRKKTPLRTGVSQSDGLRGSTRSASSLNRTTPLSNFRGSPPLVSIENVPLLGRGAVRHRIRRSQRDPLAGLLGRGAY